MGLYANLKLDISEEGAEFISKWESVELESYQDEKGIWTIGIGHIETAGPNMVWTMDQVLEAFQNDVERYVRAINDSVVVALSQKQYDALVSLCFNIGVNGFKTSQSVTANLNRGDYRKAADGFLAWNKVRDQGRLRESAGLTNRRKAEREMFLEGIW